MGLDKKEPGDRLVWTAEVYNRWARAANAMMRAGADQHFGMTAGPHGRQIAREAEGFWAKLAGAGPTYTAMEQIRDPATLAWVDGPRALTDVLEVNAVAGLANTVQFVEPSTSPGEWLFQAVKLGATAPASLTCNPCPIPLRDLTGTGSMNCAGNSTIITYPFTLVWNGVSSPASAARWDSGCVALPCNRIVANPPVAQATHSRHVFACNQAGVTARLTVTHFASSANCAANTNILVTETYPGTGLTGGFATLNYLGDCSVFDFQAKEGTTLRYAVSE